MRSIFLAVVISAGLATAQVPSILPVINFGIVELKNYLNLSDAQVQSLVNVQKAQQQASQNVYSQINAKQQQLNALLASGSNNATEIGQLTIDINLLRKQLPISGEPYRSQALAVLTADQKSKLPALAAALQLVQTANEAVNYNLIDRPQPKPMPLLRLIPQVAGEVPGETPTGDFAPQP